MLFPEHEEQAAIATVLSGVDARRDTTRALKQSMMQEFLTNWTRLVRRRCGPVTPHSSLKSASQP